MAANLSSNHRQLILVALVWADEHQSQIPHTNYSAETYDELHFLCWQAVEAREHCKACQIDVGVKRVDLASTKSEIITQIREMVSQCDLTLKAVRTDFSALNVKHLKFQLEYQK